MNKNLISLSIFLIFFFASVNTEASDYKITLGSGVAQSSIKIIKIGVQKDFTYQWLEKFKTRHGFLSGYFEATYNYFTHNTNDIHAVSVSPVFIYCFNSNANSFIPYIEGGIGALFMDNYNIANKDLSMSFQFEDRVGIGIKTKKLDWNIRYLHYSNASIKEPNDGMDILMLTMTISF